MDRRLSPRVEWNGPVHFRAAGDNRYRTGFLSDISTTGAMLWLDRKLEQGDRVEVRMQSEFDPKPVNMTFEVVRVLPQQRNGYTGYGCRLQQHEPWENG